MKAPTGKDLALLATVIAAGVILGVGILWWRSSSRQAEGLGAAQATAREVASGPSEKPSEDVDAAEEDYIPPSPKAPELTGFVDRTERIRERIPEDITSSISSIRHSGDVDAVVSVLMDTRDSDTARNEAANLLRRSGYEGLIDRLIEVLDRPEERARFRGFCVQHLWRNLGEADRDQQEKVMARLRRAVDDRDVPVRREAVLALVRMEDIKGRETAIKWLLDEDADDVRDLAIHFVHRLGLRDHIPAIRRHLYDKKEPVRIAAIVVLSQWGDEQSRPAFETAAESSSTRLQRAGKLALRTLDRIARAKEPETGF